MKNKLNKLLLFFYNSKLPNRLTMTRIFSAPIVMFLIMFCSSGAFLRLFIGLICALIFSADFFDGYFARKLDAKSDFGRCFDPIADKILIVAIFFGLIYLRKIDALPAIIIVAREFVVSGMREFMSDKKELLGVSYFAKVKTVLQFSSVLILIVARNNSSLLEFGNLLLWIAMFASLVTMKDYWLKVKENIKF